MSDESQGIGKNSSIHLGLAILLAAMIGGYLINDTRWKARMEHQLSDLQSKVTEGTALRIRRDHVLVWVRELQSDNPDLNVPDLGDIIQELGPVVP